MHLLWLNYCITKITEIHEYRIIVTTCVCQLLYEPLYMLHVIRRIIEQTGHPMTDVSPLTIDIIDFRTRDWKRITWAHSNWTFDCVHSSLHGNSDFTHLAQFKTGHSCSLATLWIELLVFIDYLLFRQIYFILSFSISTCTWSTNGRAVKTVKNLSSFDSSVLLGL